MERPSAWFLPVAVFLFAAVTSPAHTLAAITSQPQVSPEVERILDRTEAAGEKALSLRAKIKYERNQTLVGETETREGSIAYLKRMDPAKPAGQREQTSFRVQFDTLQTDSFRSAKKETYAFDGRFLHELNEKTRQMIHREVVPAGQTANLMRLGEGPFPAPFGQRKTDVLDSFTAKLVPQAANDPKGADHLELVPLPGSVLAKRYKAIQLFVSRECDLPVRMITNGTNSEIVTVDFTEIVLNPAGLSERDFILKRPVGYAETAETLHKE